jgi:hypothetical protein
MRFLCAPTTQLVDQPCTILSFVIGSKIHHQRPQPVGFSHIRWSKLMPTNYKVKKSSLVFYEHNRKTKRCLAHFSFLPKSTCDALPNSLINSNESKVRIAEGQGFKACSLVHNTSGVEGRAGTPKWSLEILIVRTPATLGAHNFTWKPPIAMRSKAKLSPLLRDFQRYVARHLHVKKLGWFLTFNGRESNCQFDSKLFFGS